MVLQNYQNFIEMTSNMIYIVALAVGLECSHKIHLIKEKKVRGLFNFYNYVVKTR